MSYIIFINHKPVGRNISRLKCYLSKTPDTCSSSSSDCECPEQTPEHVYKLKKHMQEDDGGEWIFVLNGKGMTEQTAINITVLSRECRMIGSSLILVLQRTHSLIRD